MTLGSTSIIFSGFGVWPIIENEANIIDSEIKAGSAVLDFRCTNSGGLKFRCIGNAPNPKNQACNSIYCLECKSRSKNLRQFFRKSHYQQLNFFADTNLSFPFSKSYSEALIHINNAEFLGSLLSDNANIDNSRSGIKQLLFKLAPGSRSQLRSDFRVYEISTPSELRHFKVLMELSIYSYLRVREIFNDLNLAKIRAVYFYNGRMAQFFSIRCALDSLGIDYICYEQGTVRPDSTFMVKNIGIHERISVSNQVLRNSGRNSDACKAVARSGLWLSERVSGTGQFSSNFVSNQISGALPEICQSEKSYICFFTSTQWEFSESKEVINNSVFSTQKEAIKYVAKVCEIEKIPLVIRIHPNTEEGDRDFHDFCHSHSSTYVEVIKPDSPVDTYALMENARLVIAYGSTVFIEAIYMKVPALQLAADYSYSFDVGHKLASKHDLSEAIISVSANKKNHPVAANVDVYHQTVIKFAEAWFDFCVPWGLSLEDSSKITTAKAWSRAAPRIYRILTSFWRQPSIIKTKRFKDLKLIFTQGTPR